MPSTAPENKHRRSRITAACAVCRGKRQKCSGEKPVCDQCRLHNEECWWSETKKRGPAKDYLRSLQDRLQETERLLLGVLTRVPDSEVVDVLQSGLPATANSHQTWATSCSGQDYWSRFPLNRIDTIRAWEQNRRNEPHASNSSHQAEYRMSTETPTGHLSGQEKLPSPQTMQTMSADAAAATAATGLLPGAESAYSSFRPEHSRQDSWSRSNTSGMVVNGRRYSEETREAGEALFSISNHVRTASQQDYESQQRQHEAQMQQQREQRQQQQQQLPESQAYPQPWPSEPTPQTRPMSPPKPKSEPAPPGGFPKHLFW